MVMKLFLVRHGETTMQGRYIGKRSDPPLSTLGVEQAVACSSRLYAEPLNAVYASPLSRALRTAERIAQPHALEVELVSELAEIDFGKWDGLTFEEIGQKDGELRDRWLASRGRTRRGTPNATPPGGESIADFDRRVKTGLEKMLRAAAGGCVAVVLHAGVIRSIVRRILKSPPSAQWNMDIALGSISRIRIEPDGYRCVEVLNDCNHLGRMA
jgi:broad specificity phosphatase PhoE